jgi:hypothetical protein
MKGELEWRRLVSLFDKAEVEQAEVKRKKQKKGICKRIEI